MVDAGARLYAVGNTPDAVFVVLSGEVDLEGDGTLFEGHRGPGAMFGDGDLFLGKRKHRAISRGAQLLSVDRTNLEDCAKRFPRTGLRLVARRQDVAGGFE